MEAKLNDLRDQLFRAELNLVCADMLDDTTRREREMTACRDLIERLQADIAELEAGIPDDPINLAGSGPVPIEPRATERER